MQGKGLPSIHADLTRLRANEGYRIPLIKSMELRWFFATFDKAVLILPLVEFIRRSGDPIDDLPAWPPMRSPRPKRNRPRACECGSLAQERARAVLETPPPYWRLFFFSPASAASSQIRASLHVGWGRRCQWHGRGGARRVRAPAPPGEGRVEWRRVGRGTSSVSTVFRMASDDNAQGQSCGFVDFFRLSSTSRRIC